MRESISRVVDAIRETAAAYPEPLVAAGVATVLLLAAWLVVHVVRRRRAARPVERKRGQVIRRPVYVDALLLDDLLAHVESRDWGRDLRATLDEGDTRDDRADETRKMNKVIAGLERRPDLLTDLDRERDADLVLHRAVMVTGELTLLAASEVAELLELSVPLLVHTHANGDVRQPPDGAPGSPLDAADSASRAPLVLRLRPAGEARRSFLLVLDRDGLRLDDPNSLAGTVTVVGVVDRILGPRERLGPADYLPPHLSSEVRESVRDRDLGEVAAALARAAGTTVRKRDLAFQGPGGQLSVAAIHR